MDWFEKLTGFREAGYDETRARLEIAGTKLRSRVNGKSYETGELELVSLQTLRERSEAAGHLPGRIRTSVVTGDIRRMHRSPETAGALFQVASQFNLLEMVSPDVTPEHGVTRYQNDHTQGPACAIAAGAATIYRNYFAPIGGVQGQTATRQLDGLADLGAALSGRTKLPVGDLWTMKNGYALGNKVGTRRHHPMSPNARTRPNRCLARETAHRSPPRCGSHRSRGTGSTESLAGVLLGASGRIQSSAFSSLGIVRVTGPRGCIRGHLVGCGSERATRRIECCIPDAPRRRRFRQSKQLDSRRHEASSAIDDDLRPRREAGELRGTIE